jgi:hypothetical protein
VELFWTIMVYAFVVGMAVLGGWVFFYWFVVAPTHAESARRR